MDATVDNFVRPALEAWLNNNKTAADAIVGRIVLAAKAREASRAAATEVEAQVARQPPARACPASSPTASRPTCDETELFIVEGDSAGGSAKQGRNNNTQAVLPLRGKILNAEDLPTAKVLANQEIADLVKAIGTGAGDKFHYDGLRYGKIILLMDADADGHHITHAAARLLLPPHAGTDQEGPRLHRPAAALPHRRRQGDALGTRRRAQGRDSRRA